MVTGRGPTPSRSSPKYWGHIPPDEMRAMCCENAAALYRHPLPDLVLPALSEETP